MTAEGGRKQEKAIVFMAFGDSLTVGYQSPTEEDRWPRPVPYTKFLREKKAKMLAQRGAAGFKVEFLNKGIVGELTDEMVARFNQDVLGRQPDYVIILGGSNDLGWGHEPEHVASNLAKMYDMALGTGIRPVSCTVPSVLGFDEGVRPRLRLNQLIKRLSAEVNIICVDLFTATADPAGRLREEYSNDGLHLNASGYEAIAEAIFSDAVSRIISA
jgi:lysophospholipase L1-like esterase